MISFTEKDNLDQGHLVSVKLDLVTPQCHRKAAGWANRCKAKRPTNDKMTLTLKK